jgi:hypothetical protein
MLQQHTLDQLRGLRLDGMIAALADTGTQARRRATALRTTPGAAGAARAGLARRQARGAAAEGGQAQGQQRLRGGHRLACQPRPGPPPGHRAGRRRLDPPRPQRAHHGCHRLRQDLAGCALAQQAARQGFSVLYTRATRLLQELQVAHGDGSFSRRLAQLARLDVLVLDDLAIAPIAAQSARTCWSCWTTGWAAAARSSPASCPPAPGINGSTSPPSPTPSWTGCCTARTPWR